MIPNNSSSIKNVLDLSFQLSNQPMVVHVEIVLVKHIGLMVILDLCNIKHFTLLIVNNSESEI